MYASATPEAAWPADGAVVRSGALPRGATGTVPGGMGGKEAVKILLGMDPEVKVIVSSGYSNDPVMAEYKKYGFSGVVSKPFKITELSKVLREVQVETG